MTPPDLSPTAKLVLTKLREADEPLSRKALERRTDEGKYAVLGGVKQLRKAGLATRERDASDLRTALYAENNDAEQERCVEATDTEG